MIFEGTLSFGLYYQRFLVIRLICYSDADRVHCIEICRSTYGYSIFLGRNIVLWSVKKQPTVSCSSCELEYRSISNMASFGLLITYKNFISLSILRHVDILTTRVQYFLVKILLPTSIPNSLILVIIS